MHNTLDELINEIKLDFTNGHKLLADLNNCITIFGSARVNSDSLDYQKAYELSNKLALHGFNIVTGGGGGIMEAANKGAFEVEGVQSVGLNITLPREQHPNPYTNLSVTFDHFYPRKFMLLNFAQAVVVFPGGFGTLDELFELLVLIQTEKVQAKKVYLYNKNFWENMVDTIFNNLISENMINKEDRSLIQICDNIDDIVKNII